jgi:hypothetical protein
MVKWTADEIKTLKEYYGKITGEMIQREYLPGRTWGAIRSQAVRMGLKSDLTTKPRFKPPINVDEHSKIKNLWTAIYEFQEKSKTLSTRVDEQTVEIPTKKPIALGFLADAHIGSITCKYEDLVNRFKLMKKTRNFYVVSVGDTVDNYLPEPHSAGMFGQLVPPELQKQLVEQLFSTMKGRWLGVVQGCHDDWSHQVDDFDWTKYLASQLECPNFGFGGLLTIKVGDTSYRVMMRHKYRFNSSANLTHTVKRMREQLGDFDMGCVSHHHQAAIEQVVLQDAVDRIFIRPGSFKSADRYARSLGFSDTGAYIPTVILFPERRMMIPFLHLEQAAAVMKSL